MSAGGNIADLVRFGTERLGETASSPRLDAEVLLANCLQRPRSFLHAWPDTPLSAACLAEYEVALVRRASGEPLSYITGWREFWGQDLLITPDVLVPRPETEDLVALALERLPADERLGVADVGTGSGAIAIAIALERPSVWVIGIDISPEALEVARANVARLDIPNVELAEGDLTAPLANYRVDLLVANLPYVESGSEAMDSDGVRFEPPLALDGGEDGLDVLRRLAPMLRDALNPGGSVLLEHGMDQGSAVAALLATAGLSDIKTYNDGAGLPRITAGRLEAAS